MIFDFPVRFHQLLVTVDFFAIVRLLIGRAVDLLQKLSTPRSGVLDEGNVVPAPVALHRPWTGTLEQRTDVKTFGQWLPRLVEISLAPFTLTSTCRLVASRVRNRVRCR